MSELNFLSTSEEDTDRLGDLLAQVLPPGTVVERTYDDSRGLPWTDWFLGGKTNLVLNALARHVESGKGDEPALIAEADDGAVETLSYSELRDEIGRAAGLLRELGVQSGDRVGIYMPMVKEVVVALFACFQVGAVAVPVFSAFGADGLAVRLADAEAVALFIGKSGNY